MQLVLTETEPSYYEAKARQEVLTGVEETQRKALWERAFTVITSSFFIFRTDYLFVPGYLKRHWLYYMFYATFGFSGFFSLLVLTWHEQNRVSLPWLTEALAALGHSPWFYAVMGFGWFFYPILLSIILYEPIRRRWVERMGRAKALMFFEFLLVLMWWVEPLCARLAYTRPQQEWTINESFTTKIGYAIIIVGTTIKMYAIALLGLEVFNWNEMLLHRPQSIYVCKWPYGCWWLPHPQVGIGKIPLIGFAIVQRNTWGVIYQSIANVLILLFTHYVEGAFIQEMYGSKSAKAVESDSLRLSAVKQKMASLPSYEVSEEDSADFALGA